MKLTLALLIVAFSSVGFSQDVPLEDKFSIDSSLRFRKSNLKFYEEYLGTFNEKFSAGRELEDKQKLVISKLEEEKKRIEALPEKKRSKQEQEYVYLSKCMNSFLSEGKPAKYESATTISQCFYTHNIDPRHFRKSAKGKILGESSEIQKEGDPLSVLVDNLMHSTIPSEEWEKIDAYRKAKEYKATLETTAIARAKVDIELLEKKVIARKELDDLIAKRLDCQTEMKLSLDNYKTDVVGDFFTALLGKDNGPSHNGSKVCSSFDSMKVTLSVPQGDKLVSNDPDCEVKKTPSLIGVYCDKSMTNNIIYNKDKVKALADMRLLVVTQLAQKLPVGISKESKASSIIGMKKDSGECKYLVKDYSKGVSEWVSEKSVLDKLEEINYLKRQ